MIRRLDRDDLAGLLKLYGYLNPDDAPLDETDPAAQDQWRVILTNPTYRYYGAEIDGRLVSTCTMSIIPNLTRGLRPYALIENVVTDPDYRKQGHATRVLQFALTEAWDICCYKVLLLTGSKNEATLRFYENTGFRRNVKTGFVAYSPKTRD